MLKTLLPTIWARTESPLRRTDRYPFFSLQREMNEVFDDLFRGFDRTPVNEGPFGTFAPSVDVREGEKAVTVKAELPRLEEKDVEVTLCADTLTIRGEKKEGREEKTDGYWLKESRYGTFTRKIALPAGLDGDKAEARFKNGILTIEVPRQEGTETAAKKIAVKVE